MNWCNLMATCLLQSTWNLFLSETVIWANQLPDFHRWKRWWGFLGAATLETGSWQHCVAADLVEVVGMFCVGFAISCYHLDFCFKYPSGVVFTNVFVFFFNLSVKNGGDYNVWLVFERVHLTEGLQNGWAFSWYPLETFEHSPRWLFAGLQPCWVLPNSLPVCSEQPEHIKLASVLSEYTWLLLVLVGKNTHLMSK